MAMRALFFPGRRGSFPRRRPIARYAIRNSALGTGHVWRGIGTPPPPRSFGKATSPAPNDGPIADPIRRDGCARGVMALRRSGFQRWLCTDDKTGGRFAARRPPGGF